MDIEMCDVFKTRRGKKCFNIKSYKFREFPTLKSGDKHFRCTNKKCSVSAVVRLVNESYKILKMTNTHTHDEYDNRTIHREIYHYKLSKQTDYIFIKIKYDIKSTEKKSYKSLFISY
ncbi:hypothetical protein QTP88_009119 [Uroleucon formosanum]